MLTKDAWGVYDLLTKDAWGVYDMLTKDTWGVNDVLTTDAWGVYDVCLTVSDEKSTLWSVYFQNSLESKWKIVQKMQRPQTASTQTAQRAGSSLLLLNMSVHLIG